MNIYLYANGSAGNHGCEALTLSFIKLLNSRANLHYVSFNVSEDIYYGLNDKIEIFPITNPIKHNFEYVIYWIKQHIKYSDINYYKLIYRKFINSIDSNSIYCSIGGDNYSYGKSDWLSYLNYNITKKGAKTVLLGCSILDNITDKYMTNDLSRYSMIVARETITYNALQKLNLKTPIYCIPDPAFILQRIDLPLPPEFIEKQTVGINISPMLISYEHQIDITIQNYIKLLDYIINNTNLNIALIPHVVWKHTDDRKPLSVLYKKFYETGRICIIPDCKAEELKGFIGRCRFMIAARTHASIAAYSQKVPTLVLGYSVKARGIAQDIFGTYENYVIPIDKLNNENMLESAFKWLVNNETSIINHYEKVMDTYIEKVFCINSILEQLKK